jgi:hypothetical protein
MSDNIRPGPDKQAHSFDAVFCSSPACGLHIIARDSTGAAICEVVMSAVQTLTVVELCQEYLYDKATRR